MNSELNRRGILFKKQKKNLLSVIKYRLYIYIYNKRDGLDDVIGYGLWAAATE